MAPAHTMVFLSQERSNENAIIKPTFYSGIRGEFIQPLKGLEKVLGPHVCFRWTMHARIKRKGLRRMHARPNPAGFNSSAIAIGCIGSGSRG